MELTIRADLFRIHSISKRISDFFKDHRAQTLDEVRHDEDYFISINNYCINFYS